MKPESKEEVTDIITELKDYIENVVHPTVSPTNWNVYSELHDLVDRLEEALK